MRKKKAPLSAVFKKPFTPFTEDLNKDQVKLHEAMADLLILKTTVASLRAELTTLKTDQEGLRAQVNEMMSWFGDPDEMDETARYAIRH